MNYYKNLRFLVILCMLSFFFSLKGPLRKTTQFEYKTFTKEDQESYEKLLTQKEKAEGKKSDKEKLAEKELSEEEKKVPLEKDEKKLINVNKSLEDLKLFLKKDTLDLSPDVLKENLNENIALKDLKKEYGQFKKTFKDKLAYVKDFSHFFWLKFKDFFFGKIEKKQLLKDRIKELKILKEQFKKHIAYKKLIHFVGFLEDFFVTGKLKEKAEHRQKIFFLKFIQDIMQYKLESIIYLQSLEKKIQEYQNSLTNYTNTIDNSYYNVKWGYKIAIDLNQYEIINKTDDFLYIKLKNPVSNKKLIQEYVYIGSGLQKKIKDFSDLLKPLTDNYENFWGLFNWKTEYLNSKNDENLKHKNIHSLLKEIGSHEDENLHIKINMYLMKSSVIAKSVIVFIIHIWKLDKQILKMNPELSNSLANELDTIQAFYKAFQFLY